MDRMSDPSLGKLMQFLAALTSCAALLLPSTGGSTATPVMSNDMIAGQSRLDMCERDIIHCPYKAPRRSSPIDGSIIQDALAEEDSSGFDDDQVVAHAESHEPACVTVARLALYHGGATVPAPPPPCQHILRC
jgi:hypothetical protein